MTIDPPKDAEAVGYKQPPKHCQFQKGQSGNPKGRLPKLERSATVFQLYSDVVRVMDDAVIVQVGGKRISMSNIEVILRKLAQAAQQGDTKAIIKSIELYEKVLDENTKTNQKARILRTMNEMGTDAPDTKEGVELLNEISRQTRPR